MQVKNKILAQGTALLITSWYLHVFLFLNVDKTVDRKSRYFKIIWSQLSNKVSAGKGVTLSAKENEAGT